MIPTKRSLALLCLGAILVAILLLIRATRGGAHDSVAPRAEEALEIGVG